MQDFQSPRVNNGNAEDPCGWPLRLVIVYERRETEREREAWDEF